WGLGLGDQNQEQPWLSIVARQGLFGDLMFPLTALAVNHGNASGFGESSQATAEAASQAHQVGVVQMLFRAVQLLPPRSEPTAGVTLCESRRSRQYDPHSRTSPRAAQRSVCSVGLASHHLSPSAEIGKG